VITSNTQIRDNGRNLSKTLRSEIIAGQEQLASISNKYQAMLTSINTNISDEVKQLDEFLKCSEQQAMQSETVQLLSSIIKITEGWDMVANVHRLATKLRNNQWTFYASAEQFNTATKDILKYIIASQPKIEIPSDLPAKGRGNRGSKIIIQKPPSVPKTTVPVVEEPKVVLDESQMESLLENETSHEDQSRNLISLQSKIVKQLTELTKQNEEEDEENDEDEPENDDLNEGGSPTNEIIDEHSEDKISGEEILYTAPNIITSPPTTVSTRNIHALNIVKRVKDKLECLDNNSSQPLTVNQQVDWIIKEAISTDNLSKMYEGWTAWI